jgi:pimeloyl-ACP methyl ester carboxylesterase
MSNTNQKKDLVLLPGLDGTEVFFRPLLNALSEFSRPRMVCFPTSGSNAYPDLLSVVRPAVAELSDYYVIAWSFSTPLALMLAAAEPEKVRGVILFASFVRPPLRWLPLLKFGCVPSVIWTIRFSRRIPIWLRHRRSDPLRRAKADLWNRIDARILTARVRAIIALDARELLRRCQVPILYIAGSRDRVVPRHNVHEIVRLKPSVRVRTILGGHFAIYQNPAAGAAAIASFVRDCIRSPAGNSKNAS